MTNVTSGAVEAVERLTKFYVASRASLPERPAMWRRFRDQGVNITSTWIDEAGEGETACNAELWTRIEREVREADALVLYARADDFPLKGALVEVGMALALGRVVYVCAPDVQLDPHSLRPLGSWAKHPLVTFVDDVAFPFARHEIAAMPATPSDQEKLAKAMREAILLIDEINERGESRAFYGIVQGTHGKLCTIRATLQLALTRTEGSRT